jgi:glycosyltransferase involved in cell wall biosynthesis
MSRILLAVTEINQIGGMASHLSNVALELKRRGWEVHCVATNTRGDYFDAMSATAACYDLSSVPLSPKKVFMAADIVNSIRPDVVMTNNCALLQYGFPLLDSGIKPVSVLHSDDARFYAIAAIFSRRVFRWISPTAGVAGQFRPFVPERLRGRIRVIPHGISMKNFFPAESKHNNSPFQILFVGFLGETKGADLLPDIFQKAATAIPDAFLTIVGDGPLRPALVDEFERRRLQSKVGFRGSIPSNQTAEIMRASDVLLLPTNLEGFGLAIVEAMMSGVVPVVSRLNGITDQLVQHNETGILVTPRDIEGFAGALDRIHRDRGLLQTMSHEAQKAAEEKFSVETMVDNYELLFAESDDREVRKKMGRFAWYGKTAVQFLHKRMQ